MPSESVLRGAIRAPRNRDVVVSRERGGTIIRDGWTAAKGIAGTVDRPLPKAASSIINIRGAECNFIRRRQVGRGTDFVIYRGTIERAHSATHRGDVNGVDLD